MNLTAKEVAIREDIAYVISYVISVRRAAVANRR